MWRLKPVWASVFAASTLCLAAHGGTVDSYGTKVAPLITPAKLAGLGKRAANPRVHKYVALLARATTEGLSAQSVAKKAVKLAGMKGDAGKLTVNQMVRNLQKAREFRCLGPEAVEEMGRGRAPRIQRGTWKDDELSVDHIIPRTVAPELDNVIANLELMPLRLNKAKNSSVTERQVSLARRLNKAHLLSKDGVKSVERAARKPVKPAGLHPPKKPTSRSRRLSCRSFCICQKPGTRSGRMPTSPSWPS